MKRNLFSLLTAMLIIIAVSATSSGGNWTDRLQDGKNVLPQSFLQVKKRADSKSKQQHLQQDILPMYKISNVDKTIYGFQLHNTKSEDAIGIVSFNLNAPENISMIHPQELSVCAGAYANGKYYLYQYTPSSSGSYPLAFVSFDMTTGKETEIADYSEMPTLFSDMTFDYSTNTMYALGVSSKGSVLLTVNLSDGSFKQIGILGNNFYTLAADYDGQLYGIEQNGFLCKIDKEKGIAARIGYTGVVPRYIQSMEFDHSDGTLYWAVSDGNEKAYLATVDPHTGRAGSLGKLQDDSEICALYIPFTRPAGNTPAKPEKLTIKPGTKGALSAVISWENPTIEQSGTSLTELTKVGLFRNGILIKTIDHPVMGANESYQDKDPLNGISTYKVIAENSNGSGLAQYHSVYIGEDVPEKINSILLQRVGSSGGKLTWSEPQIGQNGGWINPQDTRYKITRMPDNKVLSSSFQGNSYEDNSIALLKNYSYKIQPTNFQGQGIETVSEKVYLGTSLTLPYQCNFDTKEKFTLWTVIDNNNDHCTWDLSKYADGQLGAEYTGSNLNEGDDWLISAPVKMEAGKSYRLSFTIRATSVRYAEKMKVYMGKGNNITSQTRLLGEYDMTYETRKKQTIIIDGLDTDDYNIGFYACSKAKMFQFHLTDIVLKENTEGVLIGKITTNGTGISGATVELEGSKFKAVTDSAGNYLIDEIDPADYKLNVSCKGYESFRTNIRIETKQKLTQNADLVSLKKYPLKGKLVNALGNAVKNAEITLKGYENYHTQSGIDGTFSINAYKASGYKLSITKERFLPVGKEINIEDAAIELGNVPISEKILSPTNVKAESTKASAQINWESPKDERMTFRYDDGVQVSEMGIRFGSKKAIVGTIFKNPMTLTSMSWFTTDTEEPHYSINIFVFELDKNGNPTNKIIYSKENVPVTDGEWISYTFPEAIEAPQGVMLAVSYDGFVSIATDAGNNPDYPFIQKTQCYSSDYTTGKFTFVEEKNLNCNFFIRAEGFSLGKQAIERVPEKNAVDAVNNTYAVWRFAKGEEKNESNWTLLTSSPISLQNYTDKDTWSTLASGMYRYAVKAIYNNGEYSDATLSNIVDKGLSATITIPVQTNTPKNEALGAKVILTETSNGHVYLDSVNKEEKAIFTNVKKGIYKLSIKLEGFSELIKENLDFSTSDEYTTETCMLTEKIEAPFNLELVETEIPTERILNWNVAPAISDDFESHTDFIINSPGKVEWSYIDGDGSKTYNLSNKFSGVGDPMAYVVFNPSTTNPVMETPDIEAHSGKKFLACITANTPPNNDLIISPSLRFPKDFTLKFFAKTFKNYGLEKIKIGYSISGKEMDNFIWLTETAVEVPQEKWTEYIYTIPGGAKYVTIACVSNNNYILMLDDIFIGYEEKSNTSPLKAKAQFAYEVFLNDVKVAQTNETTYKFTSLRDGKHTVGVRSMYTSGNSDLSTLEFSMVGVGIKNESRQAPAVYPNPVKDRIYITGEYSQAQVLSIGGRSILVSSYQPEGIEVEHLEKGVYIIKITTPEGISLCKIIKN